MCFHLTILAALAGVGPPPCPAPDPDVTLGYVAKGHAFALARTVGDPPCGALYGFDLRAREVVLHLSRRPLAGAAKRKLDRVDDLESVDYLNLPARFRIHGDSWFAGYYRTFQQVSLTAMDERYGAGEDRRRGGAPGLSMHIDGLNPAEWTIKPVEEALEEVLSRLESDGPEGVDGEGLLDIAHREVGYDLLPTEKNQAMLFWLHKGRMHVAGA